MPHRSLFYELQINIDLYFIGSNEISVKMKGYRYYIRLE